MNEPDTYKKRRYQMTRRVVDAGPRVKKKNKKACLGFFAMPHAFISHENRAELQRNAWA